MYFVPARGNFMSSSFNQTHEGGAPLNAPNKAGEGDPMDCLPPEISAETDKKYRNKRRVQLSQRPINVTPKVYRTPTPRYLLISRDEGNFKQVSPFIILREVTSIAGGPVKEIKKIANGLLVEVKDITQTPRLLASKRLGEYAITVSPHSSLNSSKGVIVCYDLVSCTEEEIVKEMRSQGVINCKRLTRMEEGERKPSASHILTFDRPILPLRVTAGIHTLDVRAYIPPPLRCYRCQKFGHTQERCRSDPICSCGIPPHGEDPCADPPKCINCGSAHSCRSRNCSVYKKEAQIQTIKIVEHLSYAEAKKRVPNPTLPNATYSQVAQSTPNLPSIDISTLIQQLTPAITAIIEQTLMSKLGTSKSTTAAPSKEATPCTSNQTAPSQSEVSTKEIDPSLIPLPVSAENSQSPSQRSQSSIEPLQDPVRNTFVKPQNTETSTLASDSSLSADADPNLTPRKRKKKGWPKGKPRTPIPHSQ